MTWKDCPAGWVSATLFPAYLKMGKDNNGEMPTTIAFGPELHSVVLDLIEDRLHNVKGPDGYPIHDYSTFMCMDLVRDESLGEDGWEMRWA